MVHASMLLARGRVEEALGEIDVAVALQRGPRGAITRENDARAAFALLGEGRREEASVLLSGLLELGDRLVLALNDLAIVDGAWTAYDLGRGRKIGRR